MSSFSYNLHDPLGTSSLHNYPLIDTYSSLSALAGIKAPLLLERKLFDPPTKSFPRYSDHRPLTKLDATRILHKSDSLANGAGSFRLLRTALKLQESSYDSTSASKWRDAESIKPSELTIGSSSSVALTTYIAANDVHQQSTQAPCCSCRETLAATYRDMLAEMREKFCQEAEKKAAAHAKEIQQLGKTHAEKMEALRAAHEATIKALIGTSEGIAGDVGSDAVALLKLENIRLKELVAKLVDEAESIKSYHEYIRRSGWSEQKDESRMVDALAKEEDAFALLSFPQLFVGSPAKEATSPVQKWTARSTSNNKDGSTLSGHLQSTQDDHISSTLPQTPTPDSPTPSASPSISIQTSPALETKGPTPFKASHKSNKGQQGLGSPAQGTTCSPAWNDSTRGKATQRGTNGQQGHRPSVQGASQRSKHPPRSPASYESAQGRKVDGYTRPASTSVAAKEARTTHLRSSPAVSNQSQRSGPPRSPEVMLKTQQQISPVPHEKAFSTNFSRTPSKRAPTQQPTPGRDATYAKGRQTPLKESTLGNKTAMSPGLRNIHVPHLPKGPISATPKSAMKQPHRPHMVNTSKPRTSAHSAPSPPQSGRAISLADLKHKSSTASFAPRHTPATPPSSSHLSRSPSFASPQPEGGQHPVQTPSTFVQDLQALAREWDLEFAHEKGAPMTPKSGLGVHDFSPSALRTSPSTERDAWSDQMTVSPLAGDISPCLSPRQYTTDASASIVRCARCGLNDDISPGLCIFHPALLEEPGPFRHSHESRLCSAAGHMADMPGCHARKDHYYPDRVMASLMAGRQASHGEISANTASPPRHRHALPTTPNLDSGCRQTGQKLHGDGSQYQPGIQPSTSTRSARTAPTRHSVSPPSPASDTLEQPRALAQSGSLSSPREMAQWHAMHLALPPDILRASSPAALAWVARKFSPKAQRQNSGGFRKVSPPSSQQLPRSRSHVQCATSTVARSDSNSRASTAARCRSPRTASEHGQDGTTLTDARHIGQATPAGRNTQQTISPRISAGPGHRVSPKVSPKPFVVSRATQRATPRIVSSSRTHASPPSEQEENQQNARAFAARNQTVEIDGNRATGAQQGKHEISPKDPTPRGASPPSPRTMARTIAPKALQGRSHPALTVKDTRAGSMGQKVGAEHGETGLEREDVANPRDTSLRRGSILRSSTGNIPERKDKGRALRVSWVDQVGAHSKGSMLRAAQRASYIASPSRAADQNTSSRSRSGEVQSLTRTHMLPEWGSAGSDFPSPRPRVSLPIPLK